MSESNKDNKVIELSKKIDEHVSSVVSQTNLFGFQRAHAVAVATIELRSLLNKEYMNPIMSLQGSRIGFKTDKNYPEQKVRDCLIEAVLMGVQPHGNQFNIIAGNTYITKEGFGYLLANFQGLSYSIIPQIPRVDKKTGSAVICMVISWSISNGESKSINLDIPLKGGDFGGVDALIGKATRKARAWLYSTISGSEVSDGDIQDVSFINQNEGSLNPEEEAEAEQKRRIIDSINSSKTLDELVDIEDTLIAEDVLTQELQDLIVIRTEEIDLIK